MIVEFRTYRLKPGSVPSKLAECQPIQGPAWRWPDDNFPKSDLYKATIGSTKPGWSK